MTLSSAEFPETIRIFDTTLRDGEQTPGVSLTLDEKLWIARKLDELGVDVIEAGSPITSSGERQAIKKIASDNLNAEICGFTRALQQDIDAALKCGLNSIHLVIPTSDIHLKHKLKKTREQIKELGAEATEYAKDHGLIVEYSAEDATRTKRDFLKEMFKIGVEAGADRACVCDTVGIITPEKMHRLIHDLKKDIKIPLSVHCHDDFGLAVANSVAALKAGAEQIHVTINGLGERAGNASLEELVMALNTLYGKKLNINTRLLVSTSELVERLTGVPVSPNKAIVGENAFAHEAGIHVHGVLESAKTYEPITPETVGHKRRLVLGKHVGTHSLQTTLQNMKVKVTEEQFKQIFDRIKDLGDKGKTVTDADLQAITEAVLGVVGEKAVELDELTVVAGNTVTPTASVKLKVQGKERVESGVGVGPVDAAINAIRQAIEEIAEINLEEYRVEAITGGTDAVVDVIVKLSKDGKIVTARGVNADIIMASVEAMISGVNRLLVG